MRRFFAIVKTMIKSSVIINSMGGRNATKKRRNSGIATVIVCYLIVGAAFFFSSFMSLRTGASVNLEVEAFVPALFQVILIAFALSFLNSFSLYFLVSDNEIYMSMPLKTTTIFWGRFFSSNFYSLISSVALFGSFFLAYFIAFGFSFYALIAGIITILAFTIVFNIMAFVIGNILGSFFNLAAHRERFSLVMSILMVIVIIASIIPNMLGDGGSSGTNEEIIIDTIIKTYNQYRWADFLTHITTRAALIDGPQALLYDLYAVLIIAAFILIGVFFAFTLYIKNILKATSGHKARKKAAKVNALLLFEKDLDKYAGHPLRILVRREVKSILQSGMLLFNFVIPVLFVFVGIIVAFFAVAFSGADQGTLSMMYIILISTSSINPTLCSICLSKEGENFDYLKTLPITVKQLVKSKMIPSLVFSIVPPTILSLAVLFTFKVSPLLPIFGLVFSLVLMTAFNYFDLFIESMSALLVWQNEVQYIKRTVNVLPHMGITVVFTVVAVIMLFLSQLAGLPAFMAIVFVLPLALGFLILSERMISHKFERNLARL